MFLIVYEYSDWDSHSFDPLFLVATKDEAEFAIMAIKDEIEQVEKFHIEYAHDWKEWDYETRKQYNGNVEKYFSEFEEAKKENLERAREIFKVYPGIENGINGERVCMHDLSDNKGEIYWIELPVKKVEI